MSAYQQMPAAQGCACSADISQIEVGGFIVGIAGLRGILGAFQRAGREPDPSLADDLLAMVKVYNYVAPNSDDEYKVGLLREYTRYWNARLPAPSAATAASVRAAREKPETHGPIARAIGTLQSLLKRAAASFSLRRAR